MIIIYSNKDIAGRAIARKLKESGVAFDMLEVDSELIYCDEEIEDVRSDYLIFISKHKSESAMPCFTVHTPGNWTKAEKGGKEKTLCKAKPSAMKTIAMNIAKHVDIPKLGWPFYLECTHHGPFTEIPCFFVEIGSSEKEWGNELAAKIVADAIIGHTFKPYKWPVAMGVGGGHYCPKFTKYELAGATETNAWAFSQILPGYHVDAIDFETFKHGLESSFEKVEKILLDWKGLKADGRNKIISFSEQLGVAWKKL
jgi:D-aminoacyl-tRNA deacylase